MRTLCYKLLNLTNRMPKSSSRAARCRFVLHTVLFCWTTLNHDNASLWRATRLR